MCLLAGQLTGCSQGPRGPLSIERDSAGIRIVVSERPLEEWALSTRPTLTLGSIDAPGPARFHQVEAGAFLTAERFVVANRGTEELRFFRTDGTFEGAAGGAGNGPAEFRGLSWIRVRDDSILTYDWGNDRVSVRDLAGTYRRSFRLAWSYGLLTPRALLRDRMLLAISVRHMTELSAGTQVDRALVTLHDLEGAIVDSVARLPVGQRVVHREGDLQTTIGLPLSPPASFTPADGGFCHAFGFGLQIDCYDPDGRLASILRVDSLPRPVKSADADRAFDHERERARANGNDARDRALLRARPSMVFPEHLPAFTGLVTDDAGRLWARRYVLPGRTRVDWWVFEGGRWRSRLQADAAFEIMDIRGDAVLGSWRDQLGVEHVRIHAIERRRSPAGSRPAP